MRENLHTGLLVFIALIVVYGTFIKEDTPRSRQTVQPKVATPSIQPTNPTNSTSTTFNPQQEQRQAQLKTTTPAEEATSMKFDNMTHNFGTIKQNTENEYVFTFTNTGNKPLIIESAQGSCGCTVPEYPKEPIAPGASNEIRVVYKPGTQKGNQTKTVTLTANTNPRQTRLNIQALVEEETK